jgi:hypothetical protein
MPSLHVHWVVVVHSAGIPVPAWEKLPVVGPLDPQTL